MRKRWMNEIKKNTCFEHSRASVPKHIHSNFPFSDFYFSLLLSIFIRLCCFFFHSFLFHVFTIWRGTECDASELDQIGGSDASTSQCVTVSAHSSALESASKMRCLSCACVRVPRKNIILMIWIIYTWIQVNYNTYTQSQAAAVNDFSWFHANKNKSFPAALSLSLVYHLWPAYPILRTMLAMRRVWSLRVFIWLLDFCTGLSVCLERLSWKLATGEPCLNTTTETDRRKREGTHTMQSW